MGLARAGLTAGEDDGLDGTVKLRERDLEGHLDGVYAQLRALPLLRGLEHQGEGHEVGHVELLERLDRLGGVLAGGAADEGEPGETDDRLDVGAARAEGVVEELLDCGSGSGRGVS